MEPLPPDPYLALGLPKDATSAAISKAYRKAALLCHPDKVQGKDDEFLKIQQAYEILGDEDKKQRYDDQARLANLKKEVQARRAREGGTAFERNPPSSYPRGPSQAWYFEERRPSPRYDDEYYDGFEHRASARKYPGYESATRQPPAPKMRPEAARARAGKPDPREKERERTVRKKEKTKATTKDRGMKYASVEVDDSGDSDDATFDRRRDQQERERAREQENMRFEQDRAARAARRPSDDYPDERAKKLYEQESTLNEYISRAKTEGGPTEAKAASPPPPYRSNSQHEREQSRDMRRESQEARPDPRLESRQEPPRSDPRQETRPAASARRSSTTNTPKKEKETPVRTRSSKDSRDSKRSTRESPEIPDSQDFSDKRRVPPLFTSSSSPSEIRIPTSDSRRKPVEPEFEVRTPPKPQRSETMPSKTTSPTERRTSAPTPRRNDSTPIAPSNLRQMETNDSGYSTSNSPSEVQAPIFPEVSNMTSTKYYYSSDGKDQDNGHNTILREPGKPKRRSPSPITPKDKGRVRSSNKAEKTPAHTRSASYNISSDRDREQVSTPPTSNPKRPGLVRNSSSRGKVPSLERGSSMPTPHASPRTSGVPPGRLRTGGDESQWDDIFASPSDMFSNPFKEENVRRVSQNDVRYAKQYSPEDVRYSPQFRNDGFDPAASRRMSADTITLDNHREYLAGASSGGSGSTTPRKGSVDKIPTKFRQPRRAETFAAG